MNLNRRNFLKSSSLALVGTATSHSASSFQIDEKNEYSNLDKILTKPVLKKELFPAPVIIDTLELLRYKNNFICRVRSTDGEEGISVGNNMQMVSLYPIFTERLQPFFPGKDARDLEKILEEVYVYQSNYKLQSLALWVPLATIEFAVLDMLGKIAGKPMGELIGKIYHNEIAVYQANNFRGKTAQESIEGIKRQVEETQAKAVKFKIGGRMSNNADYPPGRTEELIPLVRKTFGENMTIYADSNGSYTVDEAIRIGRVLQEYKIDFYEEPVPFDWYEDTLEVAKALAVPIAGGEQEPSMHNFRWLIANDALQIVQPDIFYFGGMIRSMKVALMADLLGKPCVPHISGSGLGYLYMMHFVSAIPNAGPFHEFKGFNNEIPLECKTSDLESNNGVVTVPSGPGLGVEIDPEFIGRHKLVKG
ncbi:mandelate racemase/muconate lactonizing enzyme family protein [Maribellus comscasis]|uniref:Mandelate racemase/muconate lactonizing enzyme family protein n=1 Tax=Maribellus comscasis TaxID=2681766 RepID=A0A6I6JWR4_9BACT|nr:mandelate racemase/muconate lactonizing enzyme family protein [Maribellus comscasis]QGY43563.1 mandelate racemase/muconate lactonizing enzyme family protein [Maribellus comscasis]